MTAAGPGSLAHSWFLSRAPLPFPKDQKGAQGEQGFEGKEISCCDRSVLKRGGKMCKHWMAATKDHRSESTWTRHRFQSKEWTQQKAKNLVFPVSLRWVVVCFTFTVGKFHSPFPRSPFPSILLFKLFWVWSHSIRLWRWVPEISCCLLSGLMCLPCAFWGVGEPQRGTSTMTSHLVPLPPYP